MKYLLPWQIVRVSGQSMTPTLLDGDVVLVSHRARIVSGAVVTARFRSAPDLLVVKRTVRREGAGWWLVSDNARAGADSETMGVAEVFARALWRWPAGRSARGGRRRPQRLAPQPPSGL